MRKFNLICGIVLLVSFNNAWAQNFFPLNVGNKYQIKNEWDHFMPGGLWEGGTNYIVSTVLYDSLINGDHFFLFNSLGQHSPFPQNSFFHYDSSIQKLMIKLPSDDTVRLAADFNAPLDSHFISYIYGSPKLFTSRGITPNLVLGDTLLTYQMNGSLNSDVSVQYNFTDKIGFTHFRYMNIYILYYGYDFRYNTISAMVDSSVFNPFVLGIDSLYPVQDRPLDTFPFILNIPFHVSYSVFINSFHLLLEVERDSEIVYNMNYNISISNPHIQVNPPGLQVGDIIKLKASISDTSIYFNSDVYPDTGWTVFHVLSPVVSVENKPSGYSYKLGQNFPNPFNPVSRIEYEIPERTHVSLKVYGILGNEVATLVDEIKPSGNYAVEFDAHNLSSGVYIYQLRTNSFVQTRKMILTK